MVVVLVTIDELPVPCDLVVFDDVVVAGFAELVDVMCAADVVFGWSGMAIVMIVPYTSV